MRAGARVRNSRHLRGAVAGGLAALALGALAAGCGERTSGSASGQGAAAPGTSAEDGAAASSGDAAAPPSRDALIERGRRVYMINCIACHARDPNVDGGLGPAIAGSSRALVEARVLRAEYPPGYTPKRDTRLMIPLPHLAPDIDALTAFLDASRTAGSAGP